jgi:hypothetical protein
MAEYYCRHGLYAAYNAVPTWNVAQDGDGLSTGTATPAIASIVLNINPDSNAPADVISVMGVGFSAGSNWTVGGTIAASADNLATAINASTTTVSSSVSPGTPQLRDLVYARGPGSGAPTATVEIMTRAGGVSMNHATNSNVAITSANWATPPTITQFAGGASGAWGYAWNDANVLTLWKSAMGVFSYGVLSNNCLLGPKTVYGDVVNVCANGAVILFTQANGEGYWYNACRGDFLVDDGTVWAGQNSTFTFERNRASGYGVTSILHSAGPEYRAYSGRSYGNLRFINATPSTSDLFFVGGHAGSDTLIENATVHCNPGLVQMGMQGNAQNVNAKIRNCDFTVYTNSSFMPVYPGYYITHYVEMEGCTFRWPNYSGPAFTLFSIPSYYCFLSMKDCKIVCGVTVYTIGTVMWSSGTSYASFANISGASIAPLSGIFGQTGTVGLGPDVFNSVVTHQNVGPKRAFRVETLHHVLEWIPDSGYPTLAATLPDGTAWSYSFRWGMAVSRMRGVQVASVTKTCKVAGQTKVTMQLLVSPAMAAALQKRHLKLDVTYTNTSGTAISAIQKAVSTDTSALATGSASWTKNSYGTYTAVKIVTTVPSEFKVDTEVEAVLTLLYPSPTGSIDIAFFCPELELSA